MQESDLPPWERENLPLLYIGDELTAIPNFGVDIKFQVITKELGLEVILSR